MQAFTVGQTKAHPLASGEAIDATLAQRLRLMTENEMPSTRPYLPRIGLVFDFDKTLASDSVDAITAVLGLERSEWEQRYKVPLGQGWDDILIRGQALILAGRDVGRPLTPDVLREAARRIKLYPGVLEMPDRLRAVAREVHDDVECAFAVLSSGFAEIINETTVPDRFDRVWAGSFHFEHGQAVCVKRIIKHPQKALYLRAYAEGLDPEATNAPGTSGRVVPEHDMHVLLDQMIYVGDGDSDLEAFGFLENAGGLTIAIEDGPRFDSAEQQSADQRVDNLAPSDYSAGSELLASLSLAVRACAARVALRARGRGQ